MRNRIVPFVGVARVCLTFVLVAGGQDFAAESTACCCDESSFGKSCDCCGCEPYECCDCFNDRQRLLGFLPSDHCFDSFISPISNPFFFEDPRSLTEVRGIFIENNLPNQVGGGDAQAWAAQLRGRLSDNLSVIVPRLSYFRVNQSGGGNPEGLLSVPVGVKYNILRDVEEQFLVSGGATYFIPGSQRAFAGFGDGDFNFYLTAGKEILDCGHLLTAAGFRIPLDSNWGSQMFYWSTQVDYELPGCFYPLAGINWFHWLKSAGNNFTNGISGLDFINLPTGGIAGSDVLMGVVGLKWKPNCNFELGTGFEFPVTAAGQTNILHNRAYADVIFRY